MYMYVHAISCIFAHYLYTVVVQTLGRIMQLHTTTTTNMNTIYEQLQWLRTQIKTCIIKLYIQA